MSRQQTLFQPDEMAGLAADRAGQRTGKESARHLRDARRLSKVIRGLRADAAGQRRTGLAICEHLIACLEIESASCSDTQSNLRNARSNAQPANDAMG